MTFGILKYVHIEHGFGCYSPFLIIPFCLQISSLALGTPPALATSPPVVGQRNTFLNVTRLGFAAAHDSPALKAEEDDSQSQHSTLRTSPGIIMVPFNIC